MYSSYLHSKYVSYERYRGKVSSVLNVNRMFRQKSWFRGEADEMVETSRIRYTTDPSQLKLVIILRSNLVDDILPDILWSL
jgi:hypothetical protein